LYRRKFERITIYRYLSAVKSPPGGRVSTLSA
jgi:hypothetical protein